MIGALLSAAGPGGGNVQVTSILGGVAALVGAIVGYLTFRDNKHRNATTGYVDLTDDLQKERDSLREELKETRSKLESLVTYCLITKGFDPTEAWRPKP